VILLVRVLLSWFPNLDWGNPVLSTVSAITDPYLNAFRGLIPPLGGFDLSAIVAFLAIQLVQSLLEQSRGLFYPSFL
jgi:YggT family protein